MNALILMAGLVACTPPVPAVDSGEPTDSALCTLYADADDDGHGDPAVVTHSCDLSGYVEDDQDCDDSDPEIHPGADEFCNTLDDDCDGRVDEGDAPDETWHSDRDADGYGVDDDTMESCEPPDGHARQGGDCDDTDPEVHPGADELCDGLDQDCDGAIDEDGLDASTWYQDSDDDGHGVPDNTTQACDEPDGFAASQDDCDDGDDTRFPDNTELCDNTDNDCDGTVDEAASDAPAWFQDSDGDGHGDPDDAVVVCDAPVDHVADATDCDDGDASRYPDAPEVCDGDDEDCDGDVDEGVESTFYADADGDGYGVDTDTTQACSAPSDYVADPGDCDDDDGGIKPGASEGCDGVDEDCDGSVDEDPVDGDTWWSDSDGDGFGDPLVSTVACEPSSGLVDNADDCDDSDSTVHPDATELCDSADQDCDGDVDEGATTTFYADTDADGYGDPGTTVDQCTLPASGYVTDSTDCYDTNAAASPAQTAYFTTDRGDGSYDWTCDGSEEPEFPDEATCAASSGPGNNCDGDEGWDDGVAACGASETWIERCNGSADVDGECGGKETTQTQACR